MDLNILCTYEIEKTHEPSNLAYSFDNLFVSITEPDDEPGVSTRGVYRL